MHELARVSVDTGTVFLPVETPYDRDVLFEYLRSIASAHRQVDVEIARLHFSVIDDGAYRRHCACCDRVMMHGAARYVIAHRSLCARCACAVVREANGDGSPPASGPLVGHA